MTTELRELAADGFEHRKPEPPQSDLVSELRLGLLPTAKPDRLSGLHLELRDQALARMATAREAVERLEELERGEPGDPIRSPRHGDVQQVGAALRSLHERLDRVYV